MCRKLVVVNKLSLGGRELGYETYSLPKGEVVEFTAKQLKDAIRLGNDEVYGLKISEETGELVFDDSFFTTNMMNKLHIPSSLTEIGTSAFEGCTSLTTVELPSSLEILGYSAFEGCTSLKSITLPSGLKKIGGDVFEGCTSLPPVEIPDGVTKIDL